MFFFLWGLANEKVYVVAWLADLIIPILAGVLLAMVFSSSFRGRLFPEIPEGEMEKEQEKKHEKHEVHPPVNEGEAEHEAEDFVNGLTTSITEGVAEPTELPEPETAVPEEKPKKKTPPAISATLKVLSDIADLCEKLSKYDPLHDSND